MSTYTYDDLMEIVDECVSANGNPEETLAWVEGLGIPKDDLVAFADSIRRQTVMAAAMAKAAGYPGDEFLAAVYMSGMEFGIRFQQTREVSI